MIERGQYFRLAPEPGNPLTVARKRCGQNLNRYIAFELGVAGAIHLAHAARPDGRLNLIRA